jgi:hypothetical protein
VVLRRCGAILQARGGKYKLPSTAPPARPPTQLCHSPTESNSFAHISQGVCNDERYVTKRQRPHRKVRYLPMQNAVRDAAFNARRPLIGLPTFHHLHGVRNLLPRPESHTVGVRLRLHVRSIVHSDGRWKAPETYSPILSAVVKIARFMVVQKATSPRQPLLGPPTLPTPSS